MCECSPKEWVVDGWTQTQTQTQISNLNFKTKSHLGEHLILPYLALPCVVGVVATRLSEHHLTRLAIRCFENHMFDRLVSSSHGTPWRELLVIDISRLLGDHEVVGMLFLSEAASNCDNDTHVP